MRDETSGAVEDETDDAEALQEIVLLADVIDVANASPGRVPVVELDAVLNRS